MKSFEQFQRVVNTYQSGSQTLNNLEVLGLPAEHKRVRILWMYPDVLSLHGGRGDLMALMRLATLAGLPLEIRRITQTEDVLPLEDADILWFCPGDFSGMPALAEKLMPQREALAQFAAEGKCIFANGSTGGILAREIQLIDGSTAVGLGLLDMVFQERRSVFGDDLWVVTPEGTQIIGNQIQLADVILGDTQNPFASVRYGRGNRGCGQEGARTGNVIYTGILGPVLARNPWFALDILQIGQKSAGLEQTLSVPEEELAFEHEGARRAVDFITEKMNQR